MDSRLDTYGMFLKIIIVNANIGIIRNVNRMNKRYWSKQYQSKCTSHLDIP